MTSTRDEGLFLYEFCDNATLLREAKDQGIGCYLVVVKEAHFRAGGSPFDHEVMGDIVKELNAYPDPVYDLTDWMTEVRPAMFTSFSNSGNLRLMLNASGVMKEERILDRRKALNWRRP